MLTPLVQRLERRWSLFSVLAFYTASRLAFGALGVGFSTSSLATAMQFLPVEDLAGDLWRSLFYLHAQPPLFNAFLGVGLKLGRGATAFYASVFWVGGLAFHLLLFRVWRELGVGRTWAWILLVLCSLNPTLVLYEHWLFYAFWESVLLLACGYSLLRLGESRDGFPWPLVGYTASSSALLLTRALYNLPWALGLAGLLLFVLKRTRGTIDLRTLAIIAVGPLLAVSLATKNVWIAGHFSTSSWSGLNLNHIVYTGLSEAERRELLQQGVVSPAFAVEPFSSLDRYDLRAPAPSGVPVLDKPTKANGYVNYNNLRYAALSSQLMKDSIAAIAAFPRRYVRQIDVALNVFFRPATLSEFLDGNRAHVMPLERAYRLAWLGEPSSPLLMLGYLALLAWTAKVALHQLFGPTRPHPFTLFVVFVGYNVLWAMAVGCTTEIGENFRFRYVVDALALSGSVLLCLCRFGDLSGGSEESQPGDPQVRFRRERNKIPGSFPMIGVFIPLVGCSNPQTAFFGGIARDLSLQGRSLSVLLVHPRRSSRRRLWQQRGG